MAAGLSRFRRTVAAGLLVGLTCLALGCEPETEPVAVQSETASYAAAMDDWWDTVAGEDSEPDVVLLGIHEWGSTFQWETNQDALPTVVPPASLRLAHELLVSSLHGWAGAQAAADRANLEAGIAAAFCDPRSLGLPLSETTIARIEALQYWRANAREGCQSRDRWAGRFAHVPREDFEAFYDWDCGPSLADFRVSSIELAITCANLARTEGTLEAAMDNWSIALITDCREASGRHVSADERAVWGIVAPSVREALGECGDE